MRQHGRTPVGRRGDEPQPVVERPNIPVHELPPFRRLDEQDPDKRPPVVDRLEAVVEQLEAFNARAERHVAALERIAAALERPIEVTATAGDETVRLEVRP